MDGRGRCAIVSGHRQREMRDMAQDNIVSPPDQGGNERAVIDGLIERGRAAMAAFARADRATVNDAAVVRAALG